MKRVLTLILILAITTAAAARDKKPKVKPGPYVFTSKASAQTVKAVIVQASVRDGYELDTDKPLQFRFSRTAQMPLYGQLFMASSACPGMPTKQVWSYTLAELNGITTVTVQPAWDYPDDYCEIQTSNVSWSKPEEMAAFQAMLDKAPAPVAQASTPATGAAPTVAKIVASVASQPQDKEKGRDDEGKDRDDEGKDNVRAQQHQACLDLAKDNPSITCK